MTEEINTEAINHDKSALEKCVRVFVDKLLKEKLIIYSLYSSHITVSDMINNGQVTYSQLAEMIRVELFYKTRGGSE